MCRAISLPLKRQNQLNPSNKKCVFMQKAKYIINAGAVHRHTHTEYFHVTGLKYDREWEPVYQAFLLVPLVQVVLANPGRNEPKTHRHAHTHEN